eukprot:TRINITY_DN22897_c0_g2_i3.p1 TRINITY_DN22897_c0_g2~~TRINITY_DN22897_c0_g2_i3.p1  ORF type:complete len:570 (+),score=104.17 TRINITY_DN22897_c0_g2_i3:183-1892(+)
MDVCFAVCSILFFVTVACIFYMSDEDADAADDVEHRFKLEVDFMSQSRLQDAEGSLREVLLARPDHGMAHPKLGILQGSRGELSQAQQSLAAAAVVIRNSRLEGYDAEAGHVLSTLGHLQAQRRDLQGARETYSRDVEYNAEGDLRLAESLKSSQEHVAAEENHRLALRHNPNSVQPHVVLGSFLKNIGRSAEAEHCYHNALTLDPTMADVHLNLALLQDARRDAKAEDSFIAAIWRGPQNSHAHRELGRHYFRQGKLLEAERSFRTSIRLEESHLGERDVSVLLAEVLFEQSKIPEALSVFTQAVNKWVFAGHSPISFMMTLEFGESGYAAAVRSERDAFNATCFSMGHLSKAMTAGLMTTLDAMRALETNPDFIRLWFMESRDMFDFHQSDKTYGAIWFNSWQVVARTAPFQALLATTKLRAGTATILVAGSGLGEQCLFAVALGARCVAYELLCGMVSAGRALMDQHSLSGWISSHCSNVEEAESFGHIQIAWLNDKFWSPSVRERLLERLARELPLDALVLSFGDHFSHEALTEVESLTVSASWGSAQSATLYRRTNELWRQMEL